MALRLRTYVSLAAVCLLSPSRAEVAVEVPQVEKVAGATGRGAVHSPIDALHARLETLKNESATDHLRELKTQAEIAFEQTKRVKQARNTFCAFNIYQAVNFLARAVVQIHAMADYCPRVIPGEKGFVTAEKVCLVQSAALVTSMSQIILGISVAADRCQDTITNIDALCTGSISALFTPLSQYIAASTVAASTCAAGVAGLPKEVDFDRRLSEERSANSTGRLDLTQGRRLQSRARPDWYMDPEARKWQYAECAIDASSAIMAIGQIAIGLNAATSSCPTLLGPKIVEDVSTAVCTLDIAYMFFSFVRTILFIALAVEHCAPGRQTDALCVGACASLLASSFGVVSSGAGIYLNCEIGLPVRGILLGIDPIVTSGLKKNDVTPNGVADADAATNGPTDRRLSKDEVLDNLFKQAGYSRRLTKHELIEELANEAYKKFDNPFDLWMSMGYNLSDPNAAWLKEDPASEEILKRGEQMVKDLQTTREEPADELRELGLEASPPSKVPDAIIDPQDDDATLQCSQKGVAYSMSLAGHPVTMEAGVAACQSRCARTPGCVRFSYWPPTGDCRLHGVLADPIENQGHWVSGPAGCREEQISNSTRRIMKRKLECFHPHAAYDMGKVKIAPATHAASVEDCQHRCQELTGCAYFTFSEADGLCSFADKSAVKLQPVMFSIAGPRHCADIAPALTGLASSTKPRDSTRLGAAGGRAGIALAAAGGVIAALAAVGLFARGSAKRQEAYSRITSQRASASSGP